MSFSRSASVVSLGSFLAAFAELTLLIGLASCAFCSGVNSSFFFPVDFFGCACFRGVPFRGFFQFFFCCYCLGYRFAFSLVFLTVSALFFSVFVSFLVFLTDFLAFFFSAISSDLVLVERSMGPFLH